MEDAIVFYKLLEASAVDKHTFGKVDIFRFHLPQRVQMPIVIALHIRIPSACQLRSVAATDRVTI